jgi:subfamily B ATP-binding cassette protein HlyB/CyaB
VRTPEKERAFRRATAAVGHREGTPQKPKILIFDEAVSNQDSHTAEHFTRTINKLKGSITMLFITHQVPRGLKVDEVVKLGSIVRQMEVVEEGKMG